MTGRRHQLTVTHRAGRDLAGIAGPSFEIWHRGRLRDKVIARFPNTGDGAAAALALLATRSSNVEALAPPGESYRPARVLHSAPVAIAAVLVLAGGGASAAVVVAGQHSPPHHALALTGHADATPTPPSDSFTTASAQSGQSGWLYDDSSGVVFVTWTRTGDTVTGSMNVVGLDSSNSTSTDPTSASFAGTVSGKSFTLTFPGGLGTITNVAGTIAGKNLDLAFPQNDGSLETLTLTPSTVSIYNDDVEALQGVAASNGAAQAQQSEAAASASASAQAQQALDTQTGNAASALAQDLSDLQSDVATLSEDTAGLNPDLATAASDLSTTRQDSQVAEQDAASGDADESACSDAGTAGSDAGTVGSDQGAIGSDAGGISGDQASVNAEVTTMQTDLATWHQLSAQDPDVGSQTAPSDSAVAQALTAAQAVLSSSAKDVMNAQSAVATDVSEANASAAAASKAAC